MKPELSSHAAMSIRLYDSTLYGNDMRNAKYLCSDELVDIFYSIPMRIRFESLHGTIRFSNKQEHIRIPTSIPIRHRDMWFKNVYFVIGLSWDGPKAFDVDLENPAAQHKQKTVALRNKHPQVHEPWF